ncbi:hypothetical protein KY321_02585 [Candidatus Woesearchaeota archaeon]|nr:hypothetical protein [Candidatus Woesearchaeota archaeon]
MFKKILFFSLILVYLASIVNAQPSVSICGDVTSGSGKLVISEDLVFEIVSAQDPIFIVFEDWADGDGSQSKAFAQDKTLDIEANVSFNADKNDTFRYYARWADWNNNIYSFSKDVETPPVVIDNNLGLWGTFRDTSMIYNLSEGRVPDNATVMTFDDRWSSIKYLFIPGREQLIIKSGVWDLAQTTGWNPEVSGAYNGSIYLFGVGGAKVSLGLNLSNEKICNLVGENPYIEKHGGMVTWDGAINFLENDVDVDIKMSNDFVSLNMDSLDQSFNKTANITFIVNGCDSYNLYYQSDGFYDSAEELISSGAIICPPQICSNVKCEMNQLSFTAAHFDGFGAEGFGAAEGVPEFGSYSIIFIFLLTSISTFVIIKRNN